MFPEEIVTLIESVGLGIRKVSLFVGTKAIIPTGDGPYTILIETAGSGPDYTHNWKDPAYLHPGLQITVIAATAVAAKTQARAIYDLLASVRNEYLSGVWYVKITPLQEPRDASLDLAMARPTYQFNVITEKRPN